MSVRINKFDNDPKAATYKIYWHNFLVNMVNKSPDNRKTMAALTDTLYNTYNCIIWHDCLEFKTQDDATAFILTWS